MNIFYLNRNPKICVREYYDVHVRKMLLETAQILCTVRHINGDTRPISYKPTHQKHPCVIWAAKSLANYAWLCRLGISLCHEYTHRFSKPHKSMAVIGECFINTPNFSSLKFSKPPQCMPDEFRGNDTIEAYRNYYKNGKKHLFGYSQREVPNWILS